MKDKIKALLAAENLQCLTCIRLARKYIDKEELKTTVQRLLVDADKIRMLNRELYDLIVDFNITR